MARRHARLPRPPKRVFKKSDILDMLAAVDGDEDARDRVLRLETEFRRRVQGHVESLPLNDAKLERFHTNPFVLLIHSFHRGYAAVSEIEGDILPAKLFSSMETSAGRMVEAVMLPEYGWDCVASEMHTVNSALDGRALDGDILKLATLKSGPRCLNDEMSENFADAIVDNAGTWAGDSSVKKIDFTYGVLYGTPKQSNKKDWHILRKIREKLSGAEVTRQPDGRWDCAFRKGDVEVDVSVRIGSDWWAYLGGPNCLIELCTALIRACVRPRESDSCDNQYTIADLAEIVSTDIVPERYNVSLLQRSQLDWLFFTARHFCDVLKNE